MMSSAPEFSPLPNVSHSPPPPPTRAPSLFRIRADLLLASLDAARWDLAGTDKNAKRRLREAARVADGVREELSSVEGKRRGGHVVCARVVSRARGFALFVVASACDVLIDVSCDFCVPCGSVLLREEAGQFCSCGATPALS